MTTPDVFRDAEYIADVSGPSIGSVADVAGQQQSGQSERLKKVQSSAKVNFLDRLLRDLDVLVYCELSALYYMDCSIILFAVRAIIQLIFFTPKAPPFDPTRNQPFVGAIFASNLFCMFYHNFVGLPEAEEATRGYLHGGILIDFIGQKAPVSLVRLLLLDVLVLFLHLLMLGLIVERVKTTEATASGVSSTTDPVDQPPRDQDQDYDAEERGVHRNEPPPAQDSNEEIELDDLGRRRHSQHSASLDAEDEDQHPERTELLAEPSEDNGLATTGKSTHALDSFSTGQAVIMNMGLLNVIRDQWRYSPVAARRSSPYVPSDQTAAFLRERFGLQVGPDGRVERIAT